MKHLEDIIFILGLLCILVTTYILNVFIGLYLTGSVLLTMAYFLNDAKKHKPPEQP